MGADAAEERPNGLRRGRLEWALDHRGEPDAAGVVEAARRHRDGWLRATGVRCFVTLLLRRSEGR
ncbi:hypothetical protein [Saccharopolyspora aridisoli]|uniref:hypothetical protein n=1 Tax=Saccharopolyspora aridisoli TaxID=2530385 RepID=UPI001A9FC7A8|nr:hypothetical protein [Saccharopolyspora aridisoli]